MERRFHRPERPPAPESFRSHLTAKYSRRADSYGAKNTAGGSLTRGWVEVFEVFEVLRGVVKLVMNVLNDDSNDDFVNDSYL